ncbi:hypothetical protein ACFYKT_01495 [Cytobacillus sp. FJAT-53684]|uniref:Uncharacterized protein n=1 Tax=Cytobacillus mangrovibacter TaxID=3299024 RepID=A0ABW6JWW8_9BACI
MLDSEKGEIKNWIESFVKKKIEENLASKKELIETDNGNTIINIENNNFIIYTLLLMLLKPNQKDLESHTSHGDLAEVISIIEETLAKNRESHKEIVDLVNKLKS